MRYKRMKWSGIGVSALSAGAVCAALCVAPDARAQVSTFQSASQLIDGAFGASISGVPDINGDSRDDVAVGAPGENPGAVSRAGRVYLHSGASGNRLRTLASPNREAFGQFGFSVAGVIDVNGDGRGDVIVGAPYEDPGAAPEDCGRVYVFSGATGTLLYTIGSPAQQAGGNFGYSVAGLGDVNGDGRGDIAIGAINENPGTSPVGAGRVHIYSGATGLRIRSLAAPAEQASMWFGWSVGAIPDINGDGRTDIVVGVPYEDNQFGHANAGRVYVYSGSTGILLKTLSSPHPEANGRFGFSVAGMGDANGDARGDIIIGAPYENIGTKIDAGRAYVFSGKTGLLMWKLFTPSPQSYGLFGFSVAGMPDRNADGRADIVIGACQETDGAMLNCGRTYVYSGKTGARLSTHVSPNKESNGRYGSAVAGMGDVNANARGEALSGAPAEDPGTSPTGTGRAYLIRF